MQRVNIIEGWDKEVDEQKVTDLIGARDYKIKYSHSQLQQTILLRCHYEKIRLELSAYNVLGDRFHQLSHALNGNSSYWPSTRDSRKCNAYCDTSYFNNVETLKTASLIIAEFEKIPQGVIDDILLEAESFINDHKKHMDGLTNSIISQESHTIKQIQTFMSVPSYEQSTYLLAFIQQLSKEKKFYDAIVWCQITPQSNMYFKEINQIGLDAILQLQFMITTSEEDINKEVTFPSNQPQVGVSYLETLFKIAWKIAEKSEEDSDMTLAFRYLGVLSGKSGLEKTYADATESRMADILIEYARDFKDALEKNKRMAEEIKQLKSQQGKVSDFGIFNQSSSSSSTSANEQVRERRKLQRRMTQ